MAAASSSRLLPNVLDALDRLYDGDLAVVDLESLLYASAAALDGHRLQAMVVAAQMALERLLRSGADDDSAQLEALQATHELRLELAR